MSAAAAAPVARSAGHAWVVAFVALVFAVIEIALTVAIHRWPAAWQVPVALHLALSGVFAAIVFSRPDRRDEHRLMRTLAATMPFMGAIAPVAVFLLLPLYLHFRRGATPFAEWYRALFPEAERSLPVRLYQSIVRHELPSGDYSPVVSYMDVITNGTMEQRIAVVATVARNFRPVFAPVLKAAIADDNPEVRVQAASSIARITDDFVRRVQGLEAILAAKPRDVTALRNLAQAYDEYAYTGILDSTLEQNNRLRALQLWLTYCEMVPEDSEAMLAVGRILMRLERFGLAAQWLERAFTEGRANQQSVLWYMEALFAQGRTSVLRAVAAQTAAELALDHTLAAKAVSAAQLWAAGSTPPVPAGAGRA